MAGRVVYLPDAIADLHAIWDFVADQSKSLEIADKLIDAIDDQAETYSKAPDMGTPRFELAVGLRCFLYASYVIFYLPMEDGIEVIQVIHGSRDIPNRFRRLQ